MGPRCGVWPIRPPGVACKAANRDATVAAIEAVEGGTSSRRGHHVRVGDRMLDGYGEGLTMAWGRKRENVDAREVVQEAERLLGGRTLERYIARRERVPAWSLIALLGHATRFDLMRLGSPAAGPDPAGWSGTVARLARELVAATADDPALVRLQRRSLVPLELNLLGGLIAPPSTPAELYEMVTGSFDRPVSPEY